MGLTRAESISRARGYIRKGVSVSRWIREMRAKGLGYRNTTMLSDYRTVFQLETKADLMKYVRKDRYPTEKVVAAVEWNISKEYMYVVKVKSRLRPGEPVTSRNVNIVSDVAMTPGMVEAEVLERWQQWEEYGAEEITELYPWAAVRKVME